MIYSCAPAALNIFITPFLNVLISYGYMSIMALYYPTLVDKIRLGKPIVHRNYNVFRDRLSQYADDISKVFRNVGTWESKNEAQAYEFNPKNLHFYSGFVEKMFK